MSHTGRDIGIGLGGLLLALTGAGLAGEGPLASMLAGGGAGGAAAGATGAGAATAAGVPTGAALTAVPTAAEAGGGGSALTGALAQFANGAAPAVATSMGASPSIGSMIGDAALKGSIGTGIGAAGQTIMAPKNTMVGAAPQAAPQTSFQQLMSMFPAQQGGQSMYGPFA